MSRIRDGGKVRRASGSPSWRRSTSPSRSPSGRRRPVDDAPRQQAAAAPAASSRPVDIDDLIRRIDMTLNVDGQLL
jgi:hypothetical protein